MYEPERFAEKYQYAWQSSLEAKPEAGLCGYELEWNLLDAGFRPLQTVGSGLEVQSFVDYLRSSALSPWMSDFSQLEVFHWMVEWATRPYFQPKGAVYEARLMEGVLLNALSKAGKSLSEHLYAWHGNLLTPTPVSAASIPASWLIAKRRYLERCVDLYGEALATAGTHTNLSLPDALFAWDFMHLPNSERGDIHLDEYKSEFYITATRVMRAFAALFIATSASTPFMAEVVDGKPAVRVTEIDSVRNLTFPNPVTLDAPNLYRSYADYLRLSYDLVRRGIRFGNNNWTPVRARSFAEPVERLIAVTSDQLQALYARGLYAAGEAWQVDEMARQIEIQNLMVRINLPMSRVEVRTDDGGLPLDLTVANLVLKHLLLIRIYADPEFGRAFRYDREDIARARRNEEAAARDGLRSEIEDPLTGKPTSMRDFLQRVLAAVDPLAGALDMRADLEPLASMATGGPNYAEQLRRRVLEATGDCNDVPVELLRMLACEREDQVSADSAHIAGMLPALSGEAGKLGELLQHARDEIRDFPEAPVVFQPNQKAILEIHYPDKTSEILDLAQQLIRIPSVTVGGPERLDEIRRAEAMIANYARDAGLRVRSFHQGKYPAVLVSFPGVEQAKVMLGGHFDVVAPEPDDRQFEPRIEGNYLWGRGAADMKTVVATYLVWMKDVRKEDGHFPPINLLLVGNEENGESEPAGTPHVLQAIREESKAKSGAYIGPNLFIAGERTGERGDERFGEICTQNRGVMRILLRVSGVRGHSGSASAQADLAEKVINARAALLSIFRQRLTLADDQGWKSQVRFPFVQIGEPGVYNITASEGVLGVEVRSIPQDDLGALSVEVRAYCEEQGIQLEVPVMENGIACSDENLYLQALSKAYQQHSGAVPVFGRKLQGTSARFAPGGQGVVWGQSGIGPHASDERHFIPSIMPYYQVLIAFARSLTEF